MGGADVVLGCGDAVGGAGVVFLGTGDAVGVPGGGVVERDSGDAVGGCDGVVLGGGVVLGEGVVLGGKGGGGAGRGVVVTHGGCGHAIKILIFDLQESIFVESKKELKRIDILPLQPS